jgi:guanylate kinase
MARPPELDSEVRRRNGERAVRARRERAEVKQALKSGNVQPASLLADSSAAISRMKVIDFLASLPQMGTLRAQALMERIGISPQRRIRGLGSRQKRELLHHLERALPEKMLTTLSNMSSAFYGKLFVISGPGGVGKSTITREVSRFEQFYLSVSVTTRQPRDGEIDGVHYFFVTRDEFESKIANNEFMEWAEFAGNLYGTLESEVQRQRIAGKHVLLEIEVQGARQVKEVHPEAELIFISPPSWEELEGRIRSRGTDSEDRIRQRLMLAQDEMAAASEFDHVFVNTSVAEMVDRLVSLAS